MMSNIAEYQLFWYEWFKNIPELGLDVPREESKQTIDRDEESNHHE